MGNRDLMFNLSAFNFFDVSSLSKLYLGYFLLLQDDPRFVKNDLLLSDMEFITPRAISKALVMKLYAKKTL